MISRHVTCLLIFVLGAPALRADDKDAAPSKVPFEMLKSQHMAVQVKINGKGPYRLIFDTGAPVTLLSNKVAKEAGIFPEKFKASPFAFFDHPRSPPEIDLQLLTDLDGVLLRIDEFANGSHGSHDELPEIAEMGN